MVSAAPVDSVVRAPEASIRPRRSGRGPSTAAPRSWPRRLYDLIEDRPAAYPDNPLARLVQRAPMVLWRLGLGRVAGDGILTTTGRSSGLPRRIVIGPHRIDGRQYFWDPYGDRAHWYRNLVVDPIVTIQDAHGTWTARAVHPTDRDEAVALYAEIERGIGRRFHEYLADLEVEDSPEGFAREIERIHVVRLEPADEPGPPPMKADLVWVWPVLVIGGLLARRTLRRPGPGRSG